VTSPRKKLERVRDALEVPDCDCPPMWYGEWAGRDGEIRRVKLCRSRKTAREAFAAHLKEEVWERATKTTKAFRPRGELIEVYPICEHVLATDHPLSLDEWLSFLSDNFPTDYRAPEASPSPTKTWPGTAARVEVYINRQGSTALFSPEDVTEEEVLHLQRSVRRRRNGSLEILGLAIAGKVIP
jgi:hypothetical protein